MAEGSRIPRSLTHFSGYISNTNTYQLAGTPANYTRWGWSAAESGQWTTFATTFAPLWTKYSNKKTGRTTDVKDQLRQIVANCAAYDRKQRLLDRIASSPTSTTTDHATFNIKRGTPLEKTVRTRPVDPLSEQCFATVRPLGGGDLAFGCRTIHDTKRPSKAAGADAVKVYFKIGDPAPANAGDGTQVEVFPKASFTMHCGTASVGKKLYFYTQWINTRHPAIAGPVGSVQAVLVA